MKRLLLHLAAAILAAAVAAVAGFLIGGRFGDRAVYFSEFNAAVRGAAIAAITTFAIVLAALQLRAK